MIKGQPIMGWGEDSTATAQALLDLQKTAAELGCSWSLVGGKALISHGVPRSSPEVDVMVPFDAAEHLAVALIDDFKWSALVQDSAGPWYAESDSITIHRAEELIPGYGGARTWIPLATPARLQVNLHEVHHPVDDDLVSLATPLDHGGIEAPTAPLGAVLRAKVRIGTLRHIGAIEQVTEHLPAAVMNAAAAWVAARDADAAQELKRIVDEVRRRRRPVSIERRPRGSR